MATTITMPQLGETVTEGTVAQWLKKIGDAVEKYESFVEVSTDKVNAEVPSPVSGVIREIIAKEGETVPTGAPIAIIDEVGAAAEATTSQNGSGTAPSAEATQRGADEPVPGWSVGVPPEGASPAGSSPQAGASGGSATNTPLGPCSRAIELRRAGRRPGRSRCSESKRYAVAQRQRRHQQPRRSAPRFAGGTQTRARTPRRRCFGARHRNERPHHRKRRPRGGA